MDKERLMKKIAFAIEWNWWKVGCRKRLMHMLCGHGTIHMTRLTRRLTRGMLQSRKKAKQLQEAYNLLYFGERKCPRNVRNG